MELLPHQQQAIDKMHNGCVLVGDMGVGKSITALAYFWTKVCGGVIDDYGSMRTPKDVYVITTAKKRDSMDWQSDAALLGITRNPEASVNAIQLTVDSWNNIEKYKEVEDAFFIFDEQRVVGSGVWSGTFVEIAKRNQWILLSATPGDTWLDYIPVFLANGFYKNRTAFRNQHVIWKPFSKFPQVDRYVDVGTLVRNRNAVLVEMPYARTTVRTPIDVEVDWDEDLLRKVLVDRWHVYEGRPLRDMAETLRIMRKVVNRDPSRLRAVRELIKKHPRLIVFYNFDYELEILRTLSNHTTVTEWNGHKHEEIPDTDAWVYLVQFQAGAEGWNCIKTDAMCFYSLPYSYKQWYQAHGRIDRLNTKYKILFYYKLISRSSIDRNIWERALVVKRNFNERQFAA